MSGEQVTLPCVTGCASCTSCEVPGTDQVKLYRCPRCERDVPWCNGASDCLFALCDECANAIEEKCP